MTADLRNSDDPYQWSVIVVDGPDGHSFLQGQLSQDIALGDGEEVWSALLTPSSIVITSCLVRSKQGRFEVVVPEPLGDAALSRLRRFHLRVDCTLELLSCPSGSFNTIGEQVAMSRPGPNEFAAELTPQSFGRNFVDSMVSFTKGCFTGQELVGRLDARGSSVPWRLVRCRGASLDSIETALRAKGPEGPSGVSTAIAVSDGVEALGFIHRSALAQLDKFSDVEVFEVD